MNTRRCFGVPLLMSIAVPLPAVAPASERVRVHAKFFFRGQRKFFLKGVTYGPFSPDAAGDFVGTPEKVRQDLALMRELGVNLLRIYHVPPGWFLDLLAEAGLLALISIPWAEHVEFLNDRVMRAQVIKAVRAAVSRHRGHPRCSVTWSATKSRPPWCAGSASAG